MRNGAKMMQTIQPAKDTLVCPPPNLKAEIQYYSIRVMPLQDGFVSVDVQASLCDRDGNMDEMDLGGAKVRTRAQMLEAISRAIASHPFGRRQ